MTVPALMSLWSEFGRVLRPSPSLHGTELEELGRRAGPDLELIKRSYLFGSTLPIFSQQRKLRQLFGATPPSDDLQLPANVPNGILGTLYLLEAAVALKIGIPLGSSAFAIYRRAGNR